MVVAVLWVFFISPKFSDLFSGFGADLPTLSGVALRHPWTMFIPLLVIAAAVAWAVATSFKVAAGIAVIAPIGDGLPIGRRLRRAHGRWRQLTIARALAAAGQSPEESLRSAAAIDGSGAMPDPDLAAKLALADTLGAADAELAYLVELELDSLQRELDTWRAAVLRILQVVIAVFIGTMVIAMYLPIFRMGAVI
jgi:type IV pilus assembly protein PilC